MRVERHSRSADCKNAYAIHAWDSQTITLANVYGTLFKVSIEMLLDNGYQVVQEGDENWPEDFPEQLRPAALRAAALQAADQPSSLDDLFLFERERS